MATNLPQAFTELWNKRYPTNPITPKIVDNNVVFVDKNDHQLNNASNVFFFFKEAVDLRTVGYSTPVLVLPHTGYWDNPGMGFGPDWVKLNADEYENMLIRELHRVGINYRHPKVGE